MTRALLARYRAQPGRGGDVERNLRLMAERVARDEPTCVLYRASRSIEEPDVFILYEEYVDQQALEAHRETPHFAELIEGTIVPILESREREVLVPVVETSGEPGAA